MNRSARLYHCARCHCQVFICSHCDYGNLYCQNGCAQQARKETLRRSGKKYQQTFPGRLANAARQQRFRERQRKKVTQQGSVPAGEVALLSPEPGTSITPRQGEGVTNNSLIRCHFCRCECSPLLRLGPIRYRPTHRHRRPTPSIAYRGPD